MNEIENFKEIIVNNRTNGLSLNDAEEIYNYFLQNHFHTSYRAGYCSIAIEKLKLNSTETYGIY